MKDWEKFEADAVEYLKGKYGEYASFKKLGGADSTHSDIEVIKDDKTGFFIDAKKLPSQCGQFVLLPNDKTNEFIYSNKNTIKINPYSDAIIKHMNKHYELFKNAGTKGVDIVFAGSTAIFYKWIIKKYESAGVKIIVTNNLQLIPIKDIPKALIVSATYRCKKSGSSNIPKKDLIIVKNYLKNALKGKYLLIKILNNKLFILTKEPLCNKKFLLNNNIYFFSDKGDKKYEIRKLSHTNNANVIFSIDCNKKYKGLTNSDFIRLLKQHH